MLEMRFSWTADALGLRLGIALVDVDEHLILLLEIDDHFVQIEQDEQKAAHDDETRHRHAHGRERHEAVDEHAADALAQQITNIILLH